MTEAGPIAFMFRVLDKIAHEVMLGPHERKVKNYLDEATTESVLQDLNEALAPRLRDVKNLWTTFDTYSVEDSSQQRYWNDNCFRKYIEKVHPDVDISEATIQLLWRCFHFYAYHPFLRDTLDRKLDLTVFQRAVALLVAQSTVLLGTQDGGDYFWRNDERFFYRANFERIFRSIGLQESTDKQSVCSNDHSTSILEDAMDVLAMTQPYTIQSAPSPDQLRLAAQKLLGEGAFRKRHRIARKDLSTLLSLLLRLRLREAKWGSRFHFGSIERSDPGDEELDGTLVRKLGGNQDEDCLTSGQILKAMNLLPNLQLRFYQLWAAVFQPPIAADNKPPSKIPGAIPNHILAAISLIIPQPNISSYSQPTTQDMRISLESSFQPLEISYDLILTRLVQSLAQDAYPRLMLITSNATATTPLTVVGAYFPSPLYNAEGNKSGSMPSPSHLLFQLQPQFRLYRWNGPYMPRTEIMNTENETPSLGAVGASDEPPLKSTKPYWIGHPKKHGAGLRIDPQTKSVTLRSNSSDIDSDEVVGYKPVCMDNNDKWEIAFEIDRFEIFRVKGSIDANVASEEAHKGARYAQNVRDENTASEEAKKYRYVEDATEEKIKGEELKKRIQGFGPTLS